MDKTTLQEKMLALGMPSLHNVGASKSWRALIRFHDGEGFRRSCELENVEERKVEYLVRTVSTRVVALASKLVGNSRPNVASIVKRPTGQNSEYDAKVQNEPSASSQEFNRFIDTVVGGPCSTIKPLENLQAA
jgi:hypothetical protein